MKIDIDVALTYRLGPSRVALLALEAARTEGQLVIGERLDVANAVHHGIAGEGDVGRRSWVRTEAEVLNLAYRSTVELSRGPVRLETLGAARWEALPADLIVFTRPSRYCQSDRFETFAEHRFGALSGGRKIAAILDWIAGEMEYAPGHSDSSTTVLETFATRKGVCRDYVHLLCCLTRASHIPARYVSAYGVSVDPPDFHAVAQVWLDGAWHLVDPSGMCSAEELVIIGAGRDAADVPFMETPDEAVFVDQSVRVGPAQAS
jgi:transglutaminase-like putative cysteine protease